MPAQKKSSSKSSSKSKSSGKTKTTKTKQESKSTTSGIVEQVVEQLVPPEVPPVVAPVELAPVVNSDSTGEDTINSIESDFAKLTNKLLELKTLQCSIMTELKVLQKNIHKHVKETRKKKKKVVDPNKPKRSPSGFAKPALISNALCNFLGKEKGTEMARTEVTKHLTEYIKTNQLQDKENRRKIIPDKKLQSLLNIPSDEVLTYFNLQTFMKVHFPKSASVSKTI